MSTKWDHIDETERRSLDRTVFNQPCTGCGVTLLTEGDFARHFVIEDSRFLNLGNCPNSKLDKVIKQGDLLWRDLVAQGNELLDLKENRDLAIADPYSDVLRCIRQALENKGSMNDREAHVIESMATLMNLFDSEANIEIEIGD